MKKLPEVIIIGRPNVGKSTLINRILKKNKAITYDTPGVTRDLLSYPFKWNDKAFMIVDSGGVLFQNQESIDMQPEIEALVRSGIEKADKIIFLVDGKDGLNPLDAVIAKVLRPYQSKTILAVNKLDDPNQPNQSLSFYKLGLGEPVCISGIHGHGVANLLTLATADFSERELSEEYKKAYKVALVGRPNVGKSSLVNAIINEPRILVDNKAGTTRDSIEVYFNQGDDQYIFIDTAGLRRKSKVDESIEFYSTVRTAKAIDESDLVVIVLDANDYLTDQDKKIINQALDAKRNIIIFVNKWDLSERSDDARKHLEVIAKDELPFLENYPFIFGSATEKLNLGKLFHLIPSIIKNGEKRITTGPLNQFIKKCLERQHPRIKSGKRLKVYYATQADTKPPTFIFFINQPKLLDASYIRFLENQFREEFGGFFGNPIQLHFKGKPKKEA